MTKKDTKKSLAIKIHAKRRIQQHFSLPPKTLVLIAERIKNKESEYIRKMSNRVTIHKVIIEGAEIYVVWDKKRHLIITVMPRTYWENQEKWRAENAETHTN